MAGGREIVEPLSLSLPPGRVMALCGGNGAGKSTLIKMVVGVSRPTTGAIRVQGLEWRRNRMEYARRIGFMPDDFQFAAGVSAWETLCFYGGLRGVGKQRVAEVVEIVGLTEACGKQVSDFSKGMRQRLLFAQALLARPALLVLDEPTNGLDPYWMESLAELLVQLKAEGQTVLFSTHQLDVAEAVADEVVFLNRGRVISQGSVPSFPDGLSAAFQTSLQRNRTREAE
ncbi:ABC transporter ATP-binding protein [Tumebacillus flagellatus]|uniref:ABC transporter ATP-binding protein n=1 Tax=Tumebacillus flagellatus TaxID=1157490 RepID=UPI0023781D97|nr:ABC transporter ATP-binding protein [Tumebacillus flagellatus]